MNIFFTLNDIKAERELPFSSILLEQRHIDLKIKKCNCRVAIPSIHYSQCGVKLELSFCDIFQLRNSNSCIPLHEPHRVARLQRYRISGISIYLHQTKGHKECLCKNSLSSLSINKYLHIMGPYEYPRLYLEFEGSKTLTCSGFALRFRGLPVDLIITNYVVYVAACYSLLLPITLTCGLHRHAIWGRLRTANKCTAHSQ